MLFKIRSIKEILRFSGNRHLGRKPTFGKEKKARCFRKNIYFKETARVEWIEETCALKIIILIYFAFFLELTYIFYYLFIYYLII